MKHTHTLSPSFLRVIARGIVSLSVICSFTSCDKKKDDPAGGTEENKGVTSSEALKMYQDASDLFRGEEKQDLEKAFKLFEEAAKAGCDSAQTGLAVCYEYGIGTSQNMQKAKEWYKKSAMRGNKESERKLVVLEKSQSRILLPKGYSTPLYKLYIVGGDNTLRLVNGDGSFYSDQSLVLVYNKEKNPVFFSFRSMQAEQMSDPLELSAKETAESILLLTIPYATQMEKSAYVGYLKQIAASLPETDALASAIDASVLKNGALVFEDIRPAVAKASRRIAEILGYAEMPDLLQAAGQAAHSARKPVAAAASNVQTQDYGGIPVFRSAGESDESLFKPEVAWNQYFDGGNVKTLVNDYYSYYDKKWTVTVLNKLPLYFALKRGRITEKGEEIDDPGIIDFDCIVPPLNSSHYFDLLGVNGMNEAIETYKDFFNDLTVRWKGEDKDNLRFGYEEGTIQMPLNSDSEILWVCSSDMLPNLEYYSLYQLIVKPVLKIALGNIGVSVLEAMFPIFLDNIDEIEYRDAIRKIKNEGMTALPGLLNVLLNTVRGMFYDITTPGPAMAEMVEEIVKLFPGGVADSTFDAALHLITTMFACFEGAEIAANFTLWIIDEDYYNSYNVGFITHPHGLPSDLNAVDMGLPVKWANMNLGAGSIQGSGLKYAWGHRYPDAAFSWSNYQFGDSPSSIFRYNEDDQRTVLDKDHDAATALWGDKWRMPTREDYEELLENSTLSHTTYKGVKVLAITSRITRNTIYLPAAGSSLNPGDRMGSYWTSTRNEPDCATAYALSFDESSGHRLSADDNLRFLGYSIRPVREPDMPFMVMFSDIIDFYNVRVGDTYSSDVTICNEGDGDLEITFIKKTNSNRFTINREFNKKYIVSPSGRFPVTFTYQAPPRIANMILEGMHVSLKTNCKGKEDQTISIYAHFSNSEPTDPSEAVDLNLSVKWAPCNVGALVPEAVGSYIAWGECEPKGQYVWNTYKYCSGSQTNINKYYPRDGLVSLELTDDPARSAMKGGWRMPTRAEFEELLYGCDWSEITAYNGARGRFAYNRKDHSKFIFLPYAGQMFNQTSEMFDEKARYWTSDLFSEYKNAYAFSVGETGDVAFVGAPRAYGLPVRGVLPTDNILVTGIRLDKTNASVPVGETLSLTATVLPVEAANREVTWSSSDISVATVNRNGTVRGVKEGKAIITATTAEGGFKASCVMTVVPFESDFTAVDMGFPSGIRWANCNLGAASKERIGGHYAWGDISADKGGYSWSNYRFGTSSALTKYCCNSELGKNGFTDNKYILESGDDAATVELKGNWRMPSLEDVRELIDNSIVEQKTEKGVQGLQFTSKYNGKVLFLPFGGEASASSSSIGYYWTADLAASYSYASMSNRAGSLILSSSGARTGSLDRYRGFLVRPVLGARDASPYPVINASSLVKFETPTVVNETSAKAYLIKNSGSQPLVISNIKCPANFKVSKSARTIPAWGSSSIDVYFTPTMSATYTQEMEIISNALGGNFVVTLTGTGQKANPPLILVSPTTLDFGTVRFGDSTTLPLIISNKGGSDLTVIVNNLPGDFKTDWEMKTIAPNKHEILNVTFNPSLVKTYDAVFKLISDAANTPSTTISLKGSVSAQSETVSLTVTPARIDFPNLYPGQSVEKLVTVTNTGNADLRITDVSISGAGVFRADVKTAVLKPGYSKTVCVTFAPTDVGSYSESLCVRSNASLSQDQKKYVVLSGVCVSSPMSDAETIAYREYSGNVYWIKRLVDKNYFRINADGDTFYKTQYSVQFNGNESSLPNSFFAKGTYDKDAVGPCMAIDRSENVAYVFVLEKSGGNDDNGMSGYIYTIRNGSIMKSTLFTSRNFGWYPYFSWSDNRLTLNSYAPDSGIVIKAAYDPTCSDWVLSSGGSISKSTAQSRKASSQIIYIY